MGDMDMGATFPTALGPKPGAWVPRRMAHETAVHRWDGAGGAVDAAFAVDGIDELLEEFGPVIGKRGRLDGRTSALLLHATDADSKDWLVTFGSEQVTSKRIPGNADATVSGMVSDLYLFAWNRAPLDDRFEVIGDRSAAMRWEAVFKL
jgi:hypothetical protein